MVQDPILPALYCFDVEPQHGADCYRYTDGDLEYGYEFQIVQDADWNQVIHPQNEQSDVSYEAVGPDSAGHGLNWFVSGEGFSGFRIEVLANANGSLGIQVAVRFESDEFEGSSSGILQARTEALEEAACRGSWQAVLCSLAALRQWGPRPSAEVLGLGVAACAAYADANHQHGRKVWQQAVRQVWVV